MPSISKNSFGFFKTKSEYDHRWRTCSKSFRKINPLCRNCSELGLTTLADVVDHIIPITAGGSKFDNRNHQSLCLSCHGDKTAIEAALITMYKYCENESGDLIPVLEDGRLLPGHPQSDIEYVRRKIRERRLKNQ